MNVFSYLKEKGIKHAVNTIWRYKIDICMRKLIIRLSKNKPLLDAIVIESHNDFDSNGGAFYNHLTENGYNKKYKIVWLLKHPEMKPKKMPENVVGTALYKPSFKKNYYLCRAKFMLFDDVCQSKMRDDQLSLYCTHGPIGLKNTKGKVDLPEDIDYCLTPSENYDETYMYLYGWEPPCKRLVYLGYPMHDILYRKSNEVAKITAKNFKKVILWMPTFRKGGHAGRNDSNIEQSLGIPLIKNMQQYEELSSMLESQNCLLVIKIHPMQDMVDFKLQSTDNIKIMTGKNVKTLGIDNYRLMAAVDALISDYSSAAYDFLHCNKPIAYMHDDEKDYKLGYIVEDPHTMMAGDEIFTYEELVGYIKKVADNVDEYKEKRQNLLKYLFKYQDDKSCERLVKFLKL